MSECSILASLHHVQLQVSFSGSVEGGEVCELCEEMSFDKLLTLHR